MKIQIADDDERMVAMSSIFNVKMSFMTPLIKLILRLPKLMESKLLLKEMQIFPDRKIKDEDIQYEKALSHGLSLIE